MNPHYTYLALDLGSILGPLLLSFDKKVAFYKRWPALFPAMLMTGVIFLVWDELFTRAGVWGFAPEYVTGIYIGSLPIEEVLFFLFVPYACMFVYECLNVYVKPDFFGKYARQIMIGLAITLLIVAVLYIGHLYTSITFAGTALLLLINAFRIRPSWWGRFFLAWMVCLIPFFIVNGVLTSLPVVWYNNAQNLGIRLGTIPIEDSMYLMLMLSLIMLVYEPLKKRQTHLTPTPA